MIIKKSINWFALLMLSFYYDSGSTHEQSSSSHTEEAIWGNSMYKVMPNGNRQTALTEIKVFLNA